MSKKISVIIRTYNEAKKLPDVLKSIVNQVYDNYEIVLVDSGSTDGTLEIATRYNVKIVTIKKEEFNYSYASNVGAENATGEILLYLSGHSVICRKNYFSLLNKVYADDSVYGVYGDTVPFLDRAGICEKLFYYLGHLKNFFKPIKNESVIHPGILSCSNGSILRRFWAEHHFVDALGKGGEDVEMAYAILSSGGKIYFVRKLLVRHSHGKKYSEFREENKKWKLLYGDVVKYIKDNY